ncbi:MAG: DUF3427 domain-containing protein [Actinomycetota bacterium]
MRPGVYEQLVTEELARLLGEFDANLVLREGLDIADAHEVLARHLGLLAKQALRSVPSGSPESLLEQVRLANLIASAIASLSPGPEAADLVAESANILHAIAARDGTPGPVRFPDRPEIPLSASALLVNGREQPRIGNEVVRELASADHVDLLCAFVKWHGLRVLDDALAALILRGGRLRVITTTYIGATEQRALDRLVELGAEVKISYETRTTRLHAKAWLFKRASGYSTAYVGSSNMSRAALLDGLEWNVRLSQIEQKHLLETFSATFDQYWEDPSFEPYSPENPAQKARLAEALKIERGGEANLPIQLTSLEVRPWPYQREVLDELSAEREVHNSWRNLVVMATGTGKTVVAALDYRRLREAGQVESLLFVAHRDEILTQCQSTLRHVMRNGSFGERFIGGERPAEWRHVFASVQSLAHLDLKELDPKAFDMVVIDEFHHAMAPTYDRLLKHLNPKVLLGLTATPERADGRNVTDWFEGRTAVELRLWEALERGLLSPFQYFGVSDDTDLSRLEFKRGRGYDPKVLEGVFTGHDARARIIAQAVKDKVTSVANMKALGFCVGVAHARFMAAKFNGFGIPSIALTGDDDPQQRRAAIDDLRSRKVNVLFTVDLFNEGVDIPEIDTVLFLRPTESATVFLQQLGRGLRLAEDKPCLTVLDFIGAQNANFRFDLRYRALTGVSRRRLGPEIEHGFPTLPAGCHISLDRVAAKLVLDSVRASLKVDWKGMVAELRGLGDVALGTFLEETGFALDDIYRRRHGGWAGLRRLAGFDKRGPGPDDAKLAGAIGRMLHIDDLERLAFVRNLLKEPGSLAVPPLDTREGRLLAMLHFSLWGPGESLDRMADDLRRLRENPARQEELEQLAPLLTERIRRVTHAVDSEGRVPLHVHGRYSRDEALAAFGVANPNSVRQGVLFVKEEKSDLFFVTLRKTEAHYSPTTMYNDRAITSRLFQWESQSTTAEASPTGQRYVRHRKLGNKVHIFVRETKEADGDLGAPPYLYAGPAIYLSHSGERPMRIIWTLEHELPADLFLAARVAAS